MNNLHKQNCGICEQCTDYGVHLDQTPHYDDDEREALFLEWCDDYLLVKTMAEHKNMCTERLTYLIESGRLTNHKRKL